MIPEKQPPPFPLRTIPSPHRCTLYYHVNHLGSSSVITDDTGNTKETIDYHPFGTYRIRQDLDPSFPDTNYTFTGQEDDDGTGLYNYNARLYDPELGRFISADSMVPEPGNLQAFNRYSYCVNNPLVYTDPSGHFAWFAVVVGAIIGALVAGIQSDWNPQAMAVGGIIGGISGGVFSGVEGVVAGVIKGCITNVTVAGAVSGAAGGAAAGAVAGGLGAAYYGGDIGDAMLRGSAIGAVGGASFGAIGGHFGKTWNLWRVGAYTLAGGGVSELAGQGFEKGAVFAGVAALARYAYNGFTGHDVRWEKGEGYESKDRFSLPGDPTFCHIGEQGTPLNGGFWHDFALEGGWMSKTFNYIPGVNATGVFHDVLQIKLDEFFGSQALGGFMRGVLNVPNMIPAAGVTTGSLLADPRAMIMYSVDPTRNR